MKLVHNTATLRAWLARDVHGDRHRELIKVKIFSFSEDEFEQQCAHVSALHPHMAHAQIEVRAAYELLVTTPENYLPSIRFGLTARAKDPDKLWKYTKIAAVVLALVLLAVIAMRAAPDPLTEHVIAGLKIHSPFALPAAGGVVIQLQNQGSSLATRGGGLVVFNCSTNLTCSFSGSTFTLTSSGGAGSGTLTASGLSLPANQIVLGNTYPDTKPLGSLGTTTTLLHGNAAGIPSFGAVVSGDLNITTTSCTNQAITAISSAAAGTCTTLTSSYTSGTFPATAHNLLSGTHGDTVSASPVRGDILMANSTPAWTKLALGSTNLYPKSNGSDLVYSTLAAAGIGTPTACTNQFVTSITLSADAAPTSTCTTDTLASAQHANQGTTTTVLHGNASGNPGFSAVSLANDITGQLAIGNVGSAGLSGTAPTAISAAGAISCATCTTNASALTANVVPKGNGLQALQLSSMTDDGTTVTSTDTGGYKAPVFVSTGTTAGFVDLPQGTTSSAVAPCNTANSICHQAPTSVTSYVLTEPAAAPTVSNSLKLTSSAGVESYAATAPIASDLNGIHNFNQAAQSSVTVANTPVYVTRSDLDMPAVYNTAIAAGTTMRWHCAMTKTAAGTGAFNIIIYKGTNGSTADTAVVTQSIGTQTAAIDDLTFDVTLTWTSATAAYWSLIPRQMAASAAGFGLVFPAAATFFSGTISGQTTTTASDKYGLGFTSVTGTPTIVIPMVQAEALGVN